MSELTRCDKMLSWRSTVKSNTVKSFHQLRGQHVLTLQVHAPGCWKQFICLKSGTLKLLERTIFIKNDSFSLPVMTCRCCGIGCNKGCSLMKHWAANYHQHYLFFNLFFASLQSNGNQCSRSAAILPKPSLCLPLYAASAHTHDGQIGRLTLC